MGKLDAVEAGVDRLIAKVDDLEAQIAAGDDQPAIDALAEKIDAVVPEPVAAPAVDADGNPIA